MAFSRWRRFCRKWADATLIGAGAVAILAPGEAAAGDIPVDVELVIAADVSWSMDAEERSLHVEGFAAAFRNPTVLLAIQSGYSHRIAVTYFEWAGERAQRVIVPWMIIDGPAAGEAFAAALDAHRKRLDPIAAPQRGTSISSALMFGGLSLAANVYSSDRQVIDISGDGPNNTGVPVTPVRDRLVAQGTTINGLPIAIKPGDWKDSYGEWDPEPLIRYFRENVIGGPEAFVQPVTEAAAFPDAIRRKLVQEIAAVPGDRRPSLLNRPLKGQNYARRDGP